jgi:hypothetical protein
MTFSEKMTCFADGTKLDASLAFQKVQLKVFAKNTRSVDIFENFSCHVNAQNSKQLAA